MSLIRSPVSGDIAMQCNAHLVSEINRRLALDDLGPDDLVSLFYGILDNEKLRSLLADYFS